MQGNSFRFEISVCDSAYLPRVHVESMLEVLVLDTASGSKAAIYTDVKQTAAKTNPITPTVFAADRGIKFWCDQATVDIIIISAGYGAGIFYAVPTSTRELSVNSMIHTFHMIVGWDATFKNGAVKDTGTDMPAGLILDDVWVETLTLDAGSTIDVGILAGEGGGDENGFVAAHPCTAASSLRPGVTITGSTEKYFSATTKGDLLVDTFTAGSDTTYDVGTNYERSHLFDGTAKSITITCSDHDNLGRVHMFGRVLRVA